MTYQDLRIIFMGTPDFAVPSLQALIDNNENVVAVVTQPDRPKGRGRKLTPPPVKILAQKAGIPVLQPIKVKTKEYLEQLRSFKPDLILVTAYGRILPAAVLALPTLGAINVHGSLLPKYRGAAPVQWAILNGETETGITIMQMDTGLDTGDILLPGCLPILEDDTTASLAPKLAKLGGELLIEALSKLRASQLKPIKQDNSNFSLARLLTKDDGIIDWQQSAWSISCQIRGLDPWPTASTSLQEKRLRLYSPKLIQQPCTQKPGTIIKANKEGLLIACGENCLLVSEIQKDGSKRMLVDAFLQGQGIEEGTVLVSCQE